MRRRPSLGTPAGGGATEGFGSGGASFLQPTTMSASNAARIMAESYRAPRLQASRDRAARGRRLDRIRPVLELQDAELGEPFALAVRQQVHLLDRRNDLREQHLAEHHL